jgi:hypothetical protein
VLATEKTASAFCMREIFVEMFIEISQSKNVQRE